MSYKYLYTLYYKLWISADKTDTNKHNYILNSSTRFIQGHKSISLFIAHTIKFKIYTYDTFYFFKF